MAPEREYRGCRKGSQGFALTELLVAMAVLAVALIAVSAMLLFASSNVDYGGGTSQATALAQRRLEEVRNFSFPAVLALVTTANPPNTPYSGPELTITSDNTEFKVRTWVRLDPDPLKVTPYREAMVTVMVLWTESVGGAKSLRLDTLVAE